MTTLLPIAAEIVADAVHGSYCPKMCTFACPVAAATGLDEAVPWSFHREVADLADGRGTASSAWDRLRHCNGCGACQSACTYEQDVPAQVLAAREALNAAGHLPDDVLAALDHLSAGRSAHGSELPALPPSQDDAKVVLIVGVDERPGTVEGLASLARRSRTATRFVRGVGATHGWASALGDTRMMAEAVEALIGDVSDATAIVTSDDALLDVLRRICDDGIPVLDVATWIQQLLESGRIQRTAAPALGRVTWHDPGALARRHDVVAAPRQVLRLLGGVIVEPEGHGRHSVSAGPGLGMELLAPDATRATASRRAGQLAATGVPVVTMGGAVLDALEHVGLTAHDLVELVVERTQGVASAPTTSTPTAAAPTPDATDEP